MSDTGSPFQHIPIEGPNSIRILSLRPGHHDEELHCSFEEIELRASTYIRDSEPHTGQLSSYTAISYTWHEDPERVDTTDAVIYHDTNVIRISTNLANLLRCIRDAEHEQKLWVDQLCIDQNSAHEKESQIPLMGRIYSQAHEVVLWIGDETTHTAQAFSLAAKLSNLHQALLSTGQVLTPDTILRADDLHEVGLPSLASGEWWSFMELFSRTVFSRLWIVQEVALASHLTLRCGSHTAPFSTFGAAASLMHVCEWIGTLQMRYLKFMIDSGAPIEGYLPLIHHVNSLWNRRQYVQSGRADTLENLLFTTRRCATSRDFAQDRVFGVLGLLVQAFPDEKLPVELKPSYGKTYQEVFRDAVKYLLSNVSLDILSGVEDLSLRVIDAKLPSWVPNFAVFPAIEHLGMHDLGFSAGGAYSAPSFPPQDENILCIRAHKIDTIDRLSVACPTETSADFSLASFFESACSTVDTLTPYPTSEDVIEVFWRTLIADTYNRTHPAPDLARRHFVGFCLQSAMYLEAEVYLRQMQMERESEGQTEGEQPQISMEEIVDRAFDDARQAKIRNPKEMILGVNDGRYVFPLRPGKMNTYAPGLYGIFTMGIFRQIMGLEVYPKDYLTDSNGAAYRAALKRWCSNRRLISTTERGCFGLGPLSMATGDEVWVLEGAKVPFVLRKGEDGLYRVVGECYMHGIMHGEVLETDGFLWENIRIS